MIPKKIHWCWFGQAERSPLMERCMQSVRDAHPDHEITLWTDKHVFALPASQLRDYLEATLKAGNFAHTANLFRAYVLYTHGGIYLDTDVEILRPLDPLLGQEAFFGAQHPVSLSRGRINNAVMGAVPKHRSMKYVMALTCYKCQPTQKPNQGGPHIITEVLDDMAEGCVRYCGVFSNKEFTIYPPEYFYPYPFGGTLTTDCLTMETYCVHHWAHTWKK